MPSSVPKRKWSVIYLVIGLAVLVLAVTIIVGTGLLGTGLRVERIVDAYDEDGQYAGLTIVYPLDETLFPPEIAPPTFRWEETASGADLWAVTIELAHRTGRRSFLSQSAQWTPADDEWEMIKRQSLDKELEVTVLGVDRSNPTRILSAGSVSIRTSKDGVAAPLFYREVNLPFEEAVKDPGAHIRWRFGGISSSGSPAVVLEKLPVCGNCHSFSADGAILGMDVDYANDKGSYVIRSLAEEMVLQKRDIITWSSYQPEDDEPTFGLLSQVSPDGRYVASTVKDRSVFVPRDDLAFSQLFFPVKGILAVYDRKTKAFRALPGADDRELVQSNPTWSPDGKHIVFARGKTYRLEQLRDKKKVLLSKEECREFLSREKTFRFDLYRIPFNEGKGGKPEPLAGASNNGMSNYFPKYSPDGRWIVFCKADSFMLLQPDSELYIIPAEGGEARRMRCNTPGMNSWHSWSPNGRWLVFSSKAYSPYTQLFLTHVDAQGRSTPAVLLDRFTAPDRAANIPEFVNAPPGAIRTIREQFIDDFSYVRAGREFFKARDLDRAAQAYRKAVELNPKNVGAHGALGECLLGLNRTEEAKACFRKVLELEPDRAGAYVMLGVLHTREKRLPEAAELYRRALLADPEHASAHFNLGMVLLELGPLDEAETHLAEAIRLGRDDPMARFVMATLLLERNNPQQAAIHLEQAVRGEPDMIPALLSLARIRATSRQDALRNGEQAVELAARAVELTRHEDAVSLDVLAAAYAETGRFADAVRVARNAVEVARNAGNPLLADEIAKRLKVYEQNLPLRPSDPD